MMCNNRSLSCNFCYFRIHQTTYVRQMLVAYQTKKNRQKETEMYQ